jgi:two-component system sensor histidine kinase KdpD
MSRRKIGTLHHRALFAWSVGMRAARNEQAQTSDERVLAAMVHDLRTPLLAIRAHAQALLRDLDQGSALDPEEIRFYASMIDVAAREGLTTTADPLPLTHSRHQDGSLSGRAQMDLVDIVERAVDLTRTALPGCRVAFRPHGPVRGVWNDGRLSRVFENLIENAAKYGPAGSVILVLLRSQAIGEQRWAVVRVSDRGPGIPVDELPLVFDWFRRGSAAGGRPGAGLGLAIAQRLVQDHGGTISAANRKDGGATFTVLLPIWRGPRAPAPPSPKSYRPGMRAELP